jgi:hypothetical protein
MSWGPSTLRRPHAPRPKKTITELAEATLDVAEQWIIIHGDVVAGFAFIGPFVSASAAEAQVEIAFASQPWTVAALIDPAVLDDTPPAWKLSSGRSFALGNLKQKAEAVVTKWRTGDAWRYEEVHRLSRASQVIDEKAPIQEPRAANAT